MCRRNGLNYFLWIKSFFFVWLKSRVYHFERPSEEVCICRWLLHLHWLHVRLRSLQLFHDLFWKAKSVRRSYKLPRYQFPIQGLTFPSRKHQRCPVILFFGVNLSTSFQKNFNDFTLASLSCLMQSGPLSIAHQFKISTAF